MFNDTRVRYDSEIGVLAKLQAAGALSYFPPLFKPVKPKERVHLQSYAVDLSPCQHPGSRIRQDLEHQERRLAPARNVEEAAVIFSDAIEAIRYEARKAHFSSGPRVLDFAGTHTETRNDCWQALSRRGRHATLTSPESTIETTPLRW